MYIFRKVSVLIGLFFYSGIADAGWSLNSVEVNPARIYWTLAADKYDTITGGIHFTNPANTTEIAIPIGY